MQIIPIERSSIKKNPTAGSTYTSILLNTDIEFKYENISYELYGKIKDYEDEKRLVITNTEIAEDKIIELEGHIFDSELVKELPYQGLTCNVKNHYQHIHHAPEQEYNFKYEDILIQCLNESCNHKILKSEIPIDDEGDEYCPQCNEFFPYEYEYEKINDALKNIQHN